MCGSCARILRGYFECGQLEVGDKYTKRKRAVLCIIWIPKTRLGSKMKLECVCG